MRSKVYIVSLNLTLRKCSAGDNVGDVAGMGADLFGSFAESSCACLVIVVSIEVRS